MEEKQIRELPTEQLLTIRNRLKEVNYVTFEARMSNLESAVAKLIAMAEEEEVRAEEEEKKVPYAAEQEEEQEEEEKAKKMKAEEEEERKKVPVTKVTAEEEEAVHDEEAEAKKIADLEQKVKQLTDMVMKKKAYTADDGAITPETPEDEPVMKTVKIPPVKSGHVDAPAGDVEDPKRSKVKIFETPSMKPGAKTMKVGKASGKVAAFSGATGVREENVQAKGIEEIMSFAASRGTKPMYPGQMAMIKV